MLAVVVPVSDAKHVVGAYGGYARAQPGRCFLGQYAISLLSLSHR